ncbi:MAG: hypothetical protein ACKO4Q_15985 [Planctomycetota bacterium]
MQHLRAQHVELDEPRRIARDRSAVETLGLAVDPRERRLAASRLDLDEQLLARRIRERLREPRLEVWIGLEARKAAAAGRRERTAQVEFQLE